MSALPEDPPADITAPNHQPSLTHVAADGALWLTISNLLARVLSIVAQLTLIQLLLPEAFGLVALTQFVVGLGGFLGTLSLSQILITRQRQIDRYIGPAFWVSLGLGGLGTLVLALSAPVAARVYDDQRLIGLLLFCAVAYPLNAICVMPMAVAQARMKFKLLAAIGVVSMFAQVLSSVLAAAAGAGAYSVFIGLSTASLVRVLGLWWYLRLRIPWRPRRGLRVEKLLLAQTSVWYVGVGLLGPLISQGDYATMGLFFDKTNVGYYFFAFNVAQQAVVLLGSSVSWVLFPAIARLAGDPERQNVALMRAVRILALIGAPGGLLMIFVMPAIVHVFGQKYLPAIPIAQVMAAGAVAALASVPAMALITAQERYRTYFFTTLVQMVMFLSLVLLGCLSGHVIGVAVAAAVYSWLGGPLALMIALDGWKIRSKSFKAVAASTGLPAFWCLPALAAGGAVLYGWSSDGSIVTEVARSFVSGLSFLLLAALMLYLMMRPTCEEFLQIARTVFARLPGMSRLAKAGG